jgi:hypothetical protein
MNKKKTEWHQDSRTYPPLQCSGNFNLNGAAGGAPELAHGDTTSPFSWPRTWAASFSTWGPDDADLTSAVAGGTDAPRTLLALLRVELFNACCTAASPTFDSWIFFTVQCVFLPRAADGGGPEAPVISTSSSLPTEESEENSASSSASYCSSAGAAASFLGSPSGRGAGDQYSKTLACKRAGLLYIPTGALGKTEQKQRKQPGTNKTTRQSSRRLAASVGRFRHWALGQPLSWICPAMMRATQFVISSRGTLRSFPRVGS